MNPLLVKLICFYARWHVEQETFQLFKQMPSKFFLTAMKLKTCVFKCSWCYSIDVRGGTSGTSADVPRFGLRTDSVSSAKFGEKILWNANFLLDFWQNCKNSTISLRRISKKLNFEKNPYLELQNHWEKKFGLRSHLVSKKDSDVPEKKTRTSMPIFHLSVNLLACLSVHP